MTIHHIRPHMHNSHVTQRHSSIHMQPQRKSSWLHPTRRCNVRFIMNNHFASMRRQIDIMNEWRMSELVILHSFTCIYYFSRIILETAALIRCQTDVFMSVGAMDYLCTSSEIHSTSWPDKQWPNDIDCYIYECWWWDETRSAVTGLFYSALLCLVPDTLFSTSRWVWPALTGNDVKMKLTADTLWPHVFNLDLQWRQQFITTTSMSENWKTGFLNFSSDQVNHVLTECVL